MLEPAYTSSHLPRNIPGGVLDMSYSCFLVSPTNTKKNTSNTRSTTGFAYIVSWQLEQVPRSLRLSLRDFKKTILVFISFCQWLSGTTCTLIILPSLKYIWHDVIKHRLLFYLLLKSKISTRQKKFNKHSYDIQRHMLETAHRIMCPVFTSLEKLWKYCYKKYEIKALPWSGESDRLIL